jgi:multimeric flavodoxin WrbA
LARAIANSDGIVLGSPMHFLNVSAQMKAFIDRCGSMAMRRPWEGKYGAVVMTSGDTNCHSVEEYLLGFLRSMGCWTVGSVSATAALLTESASREQSFEAARELGRELARCMRGTESFPEQVPVKEAFRDRMQRLVLRRKHVWAFEYEFWQHHTTGGSP